MEYLWELQQADILSQNPALLEHKLQALEETKKLYREVIHRNDCVSLKQLAVNGKDLIESGAKPGKQLGEFLEQLLQMVLDSPELNRRESLLQAAKQYMQ